ncbi:MAG: hypothetical protein KAI47_12905, partial [Deltaproteobacteria bacterium]|nr:hypothetical protein [Deltaproteobacteria bacterium]
MSRYPRGPRRPRRPPTLRLLLTSRLLIPVIVGVALLLPALATAAPASPGDRSSSEDMRGWVPGDPKPVSPGPRWGETALRHSPGLRRLRPQRWLLSGQGQHAGALTSKSIYLSPGHGWTYTSSAGWYSQRGKSQGLVEDMSNADGIRQFLLPYLWGAGAQIMPVRELDQQTSMVILDDGDGTTSADRGRYTETGAASLFQNSSLAGFGHPKLPITGTQNPFALGKNRLLETAPSETARATFVLNVPRPGYYFVYVSYSMFKARPSDARYIVVHPGGQTTYLLDQRNHGSTWVLLGRHWFDAGTDIQKGAVIVSNQSADAGSWVSIDAVRIGGGEG